MYVQSVAIYWQLDNAPISFKISSQP